MLLLAGADMDARDGRGRRPALMYAVERDEQRVSRRFCWALRPSAQSDETAAKHEQHRSEVLAELADRFDPTAGRDLRFTRELTESGARLVLVCRACPVDHETSAGRSGSNLALVVADMADKIGADGFRERSSGTPEVVRPLREHVNVTPEGWVGDLGPMPAGIAASCSA
ncbi:hypothetical protein [Micromonospora sp. NPDC005806]|uniref:hypothetical protein n=1 Tax=Micromonospora sp. NPDC005806 TaxID=3364234 RepID=UPI0036B7E143